MDSISSRVGLTKPYVGCVQEVIINEYKYDLRKAGIVGDAYYGLNVGKVFCGFFIFLNILEKTFTVFTRL